MKLSPFILFLGLSGALLAVQPGDSVQQVLAEKGKPAGEMSAGTSRVLTYPDIVVKFQKDVVVEVKPVVQQETHAAVQSAPAKPQPVPKRVHVSLPAAGTEWITDATGAAVQAKTENRLIFMLFTGSDWCIWCKRLEGEILGTEQFRTFAAEKLVLLKLDFPKSTEQTAELKAQNRALLKQYGVRGFPTVIVLDASGKVVKEMGYQKGGPAPFIRALQGL
jgi:thiol-disulfide isomerase/thioredoxin